MRATRCWLLLCLLAPAAVAAAVLPPPALMIKLNDRSEPLPVSKIQVEARIHGFLAETRMTLTFSNPHDRQLEGDLYFPLPEGALLSGYALDIRGVMVDGVPVERDKGRQVFEMIVRQGIDPGLAEWVQGNNFKTRVFPIPAHGTRTVMVRYVSDVVHTERGTSYVLPLNFRAAISQFELRVEVVKPAAAPLVGHSVVPGLAFTPWREGYVAEAKATDVKLNGVLMIDLPELARPDVQIEKGPDGQFYFLAYDFPVDPRPEAEREARKTPSRVTILWDASGSRAGKVRDQDLATVEAYFGGLAHVTVEVDLVVFRNVAAPAKHFTITGGQAEALLAELRAVDYDGGTQLGAISPAADAVAPDLYLLFSDGLSNFGKAEPEGFRAPVFAFAADPSADHAFLRSLAQRTGGDSFNLGRLSPGAAAAAVGRPAFTFLGASADGKSIAETYPQAGQPVRGRFTLFGRLMGPEAKLNLSYGVLGKPLASRELTLSQSQATEGTLLSTAWAQKKVEALQSAPERNSDEILETGKRYGLVTPETSLIVLDSLEQYVEHEIMPPASLHDLREQYGEIMEQRKRELAGEETSKLERIAALWKQRVEWWNTEFDAPENFRWSDKEKTGGARATNGDRRESAGLDVPLASGDGPAEQELIRDEGLVSGEPGPPAAGAAAPPPPMRPDAAPKKADAGEAEEEPAIVLQAWNPDTPYLEALKKAAPATLFATYMNQREQYGNAPAFYLDCADFFYARQQKELGLQVLSNVAEMELQNAALLRILGGRLAQLGHLELAMAAFEEVLRLRPEEPQSHRDLALVLAQLGQYGRALELLQHVVMNRWDRFDEIELIALMEFNALLPKARAQGLTKVSLDPRLIQLLDVDVRIVITWDADLTDIDLWVLEPTGEKVYYQHMLSTIGGHFSKDFTQGYGPEEYIIRKARHGVYKIQANFYGSQAQMMSGAVTLQADIYTNYGRPNEQHRAITLRLVDKKDTIDVGEIEF